MGDQGSNSVRMGQAGSTESRGADQASETQRLTDEDSSNETPSALVVCGPSGVGKGTLINRLMADSAKYGFSCSHTTRSPRPGEQVDVSAACLSCHTKKELADPGHGHLAIEEKRREYANAVV